MSTLGSIFVLLGLVGFIWGIVRLIRQRKHPLTKRLNMIILVGGLVLLIAGGPLVDTKAASGSPQQTSSTSNTKALSAKQQRQLKSEKARGKVLLAAKAKKTSELERHLRQLPKKHQRAKLPRLSKPPRPHRKQLQQHRQPNKLKRLKSQPLRNRQHKHSRPRLMKVT